MGFKLGNQLIDLVAELSGPLIFSQALTLFTTPVIYLAFDRLANRGRRLRKPADEPQTGNAQS